MSTDIKKELADEALRIVTGARRAAYGSPERNFERIALLWNAHLVNVGIVDTIEDGLMPRDVAAFMRLMKEARLAETPDHRDSYVDLVGYALCGAEVAGVSVSEGPKGYSAEQAIRAALGAEPAPLQIEACKYYRTRDGRKVGPASACGGAYPWIVGNCTYRRDGFRFIPTAPDACDLVAEWVDT